jgi:hypothetical protein
VILDITALCARRAQREVLEVAPVRARGDERPLALVVDDSITVRAS